MQSHTDDIVEKVRGPVMPTRGDPQVFSCQSAAAAQSLGVIRHRFANWLQHGFDDKPRDRLFERDLVLTLSELSWAALNATDDEDSDRPLEIRAWQEREAVVMEVVEAVPIGDASKRSGEHRDPFALSVVASLTDTLTVRREEGRIRFRARTERPAETRGVVQRA